MGRQRHNTPLDRRGFFEAAAAAALTTAWAAGSGASRLARTKRQTIPVRPLDRAAIARMGPWAG